MGHYYLDSSALVKRYVAETGTDWITQLCVPDAGHTLYTVRISGAEIVAALFLRARAGGSVVSDAQAAVTRLKAHLHSRYQVVEVTEHLVDRAMTLAERDGLQGYDAVQLAAALEPIVFVCADDRLNAAAIAEGLTVENPNAH